jgi:UDP-N-acetylmuramate--alanine ligase
MCGAAELLASRGVRVRGSDAKASPAIRRLERLGVRVDLGADPTAMPSDADLVVASAAIPDDHPQVVEARRRGVEVRKYAECLGALMEGKNAVCVAGCHGKTTTSSLVATSLWRAGRDPSFVIGGEVRDVGSNARAGRGPDFVAEACEFDRSFHRLKPTVSVVTNLDADHLDYYRDFEEIRESFRVFARLLPPRGLLVVHEDHADAFRGDPLLAAPVETYGSSPTADWRATDAWWDARAGAQRFRLFRRKEHMGEVSVPLAGPHNAANATAALAALSALGLSFDEAKAGIASFGGVGRRLESVADRNGILVLDDYGHHPAEIRAVMSAVKSRHPGRRVIVVFQPHQASRTRHLLEGFGGALAEADEAWIAPIYFARDSQEDRRAVSSEDVAVRANRAGGRAATFPDLPAIVDHAARVVRPGDVVVTMGAGNVDEVARGLAERIP